MNDLNQIILEGDVLENSETKELATGTKTTTIKIATERFYKNSNNEQVKEVCYFDVECYGNGFASLLPNIKKGKCIRVVGRLKQKRWKDEKGKNFSKVVVVAEHIEVKRGVNEI